MTGRCRRCARVREVPAPPSGRISEFRCECGGRLARVNRDGSPIVRARRHLRLASCDYCGKRHAVETLRRLDQRALVGMPTLVGGRPVHAAALERGALVCKWHGFVVEAEAEMSS